MIRTVSIVLAVASAGASAETVRFLASGQTPGINTSAVLSADASSFTITLHNNSNAGTMTGFYIGAGAALAGLGQATITNGDGVLFSSQTGYGSVGGLDVATRVPGGNQNQSVAFFTPASADQSGAPGVNLGSVHFAMNAFGEQNGQGTGDTLSVRFAHDGTFSLDNLIRALGNDEVRFLQTYATGLHNQRETLHSSIAIVPLPPAAWAGLGMLGVIAGVRSAKRRNRA